MDTSCADAGREDEEDDISVGSDDGDPTYEPPATRPGSSDDDAELGSYDGTLHVNFIIWVIITYIEAF